MSAEVPPGYKQTEVGVIPEDWTVKALRQISPSQSVGLVINPSTYFVSNGNVPMLVGSNVSENRIEWESAKRISDVSNSLLSSSQLYSGDLVTVRVGEPGTTAVVPSELNGCNCASMMITRKHSSYNSKWLCYVMNSKIGRSQIGHVQYGTAQKQFNIKDAIYFVYPTPSLIEQQRIAEALSDADALIEGLGQLITKKLELKQGAMQELLTPCESWGTLKLGGLGTFIKGTGIKKDDAQSGTIPCVRYGEIYTKHNDCVRDYFSHISEEVAGTAQRLKQGDILFAGSGETKEEIGKCVAFLDNFEAYAGGDIVILRVQKGEPTFLGYYLNTESIKRQKASRGQGDAVVHISSSALADIDILLPDFDEQTRIATILSDMDTEIAALEVKLNKAQKVKEGMMQDLLTGRVRLI